MAVKVRLVDSYNAAIRLAHKLHLNTPRGICYYDNADVLIGMDFTESKGCVFINKRVPFSAIMNTPGLIIAEFKGM